MKQLDGSVIATPYFRLEKLRSRTWDYEKFEISKLCQKGFSQQ